MKKPSLAVIIGGKPPGPSTGGSGMDDPNQPPTGPDMSGMEDATGGSQTDSVPLSALAMPDETEAMQPPEVGDEVNYQVTGKVVSIEGDIAQVEKTAVNGQPVGGDNDKGGEAPESKEDEGQSLRNDAGSMGMMMLLLIALFLAIPSRAQNAAPEGSGAVVNSWVEPNQPARIYQIRGYNSTNVTIYVQLFQTNAVPNSGAIPLITQPVAAGSSYLIDFGYAGMLVDYAVVCASTTATNLTLAATPCISIVDTQSQR